MYIYLFTHHPNYVTFTMKEWRFPIAMVHYWKVYPLVAHESNSLLGFQCFKFPRVIHPITIIRIHVPFVYIHRYAITFIYTTCYSQSYL